MPDLAESLCRAFLQNAAARQWLVDRVAPEAPSVDFLTGFGAGWEAGQVSAFALALSAITGESPTQLVENARTRAAMDSTFPFELHIEATDDGP